MAQRRYFSSDNTTRVHDKIMKAILDANRGYAPSYGDDPWTAKAVDEFHALFGSDTEVFFVFNGTGANVTGISAGIRPFQTVISAQTAHIREDECGAIGNFTGAALITIPSENGKLIPDDLQEYSFSIGNQHKSQPGIVSITQPTELGTLYSHEEIRGLATAAHRMGMYLHMDGARISNAAVAFGSSFREMTVDAGVDILSFGGTKNGMMYGEAVLFFRPEISCNFPYIRKQGMQLASKMRYIGAQFSALLEGELWKENARIANERARYLHELLVQIPEIRITQQVQCNAVFAVVPPAILPKILETNYFYIWNESRSEIRLMTTFDTTEKEVEGLAGDIRRELQYLK